MRCTYTGFFWTLEHPSEFKYLECILDGAECSRVVSRGRRVASDIRSLVNAKICSLSVLVLHEIMLLPILMYSRENVMDNVRHLEFGLYRWKNSRDC